MFVRDCRQSLRMWCNRKGLLLPFLIGCIPCIYWAVLAVDQYFLQRLTSSPTKSTGCKYSQEMIGSYIFNNSNLEMDDSQLIDYLRSSVVNPPDAAPYNLNNPSVDPSWKEGLNKVVLKLLKNKTRGVFLEAGANDGESISNTLLLERNFGWTGLLVEPDPRAFAGLKKKHRKAWTAGVCLSTSKLPQKLTFLVDKKDSKFSRLSSSLKVEWRKREGKQTDVHCFPLYSLLLAVNMTTIDYVSLDIEGVELEVIKTIPFDKLKIRVMSVEYNHVRRIPGAESAMVKLFQSNGYRIAESVIRGTACDYIFAHSDVQ